MTLGISLKDTDGDEEDNKLGMDDGFMLGVMLVKKEGEEDGFMLGDSVHIWHVCLQV